MSWALVAHTCSPYYLGRLKAGGLRFKASLGKQFMRPHLQNNQHKVDWRHGLSGRTLALQV
jgi:hypothetical protein